MRISLEKAHQLLLSGHVVAVPTETVYGLAASIDRPGAIDKIFALKGRPADNPLIVHLANKEQISNYASAFPEGFFELADHFWPGPMTVVLPANKEMVPNQARAGLPTVAFRIPQHSLALALMEWVGPLVMPSANLSGKPSSTCKEHVEADFGSHFPVLDGGTCGHGLESTILVHKNGKWCIGRLGAIPPKAFAQVLGYTPVSLIEKSKPVCPGQFHKHYSPKAQLHLTDDPYGCSGVVVGFQDRSYPKASKVFNWGKLSQPQTVAENLYKVLRQLDQEGISEAWVDMDFPPEGLWLTIGERLSRASQRD